MEDVVGYTDAFVICSGQNSRHVQAIAEEVELSLKYDEGLLPKGGEGRREGDWILLDYLDCVLHVFTPEARVFYRLEQLWGQVPQRHVV
jgi:ribosome-associated protein